jgi:hypothetical protein
MFNEPTSVAGTKQSRQADKIVGPTRLQGWGINVPGLNSNIFAEATNSNNKT